MAQQRKNTGLVTVADISPLNTLPERSDQPHTGTGFDAPARPAQESRSLNNVREVARHEIPQVIQLPLWYEPERGTPNSFLRSALFAAIQSKDRKFLKEALLASTKDVTVKFTGEQLNQEDLTVWENLVHLARQHPLGTVFQFTAHGLLKKLGLHTGNHEHKRLHSTIIRLTACAVEITHHGKTYFGPLIKSGAKDELTRHYAVELNPQLIRLYGETQWTALDCKRRLQLRRKPLAQALHGYYSSHARPLPVKLATLREITGSSNPQLASFKRQIRIALDELVKIQFFTGYRIEGDLVTVWRP
jgi:hypothetical protein